MMSIWPQSVEMVIWWKGAWQRKIAYSTRESRGKFTLELVSICTNPKIERCFVSWQIQRYSIDRPRQEPESLK